jgi:6-pyruvoyltetrahydropterin/6-carboxytetrahydropterin synthase
MLIWEHDPILAALRVLDDSIVAVPFNPTAENMAAHMARVVGPALLQDHAVRLVRVHLEETGKCSATYFG